MTHVRGLQVRWMWAPVRVNDAIRVVAFDHCDDLRCLDNLGVANRGAGKARGLTTLFRVQRCSTAYHGRCNFLHLLHVFGLVRGLVWCLAFFINTEWVLTLIHREIKQNRSVGSA